MSKLYVVATPIGNLNDLSPRAAQALTECDLIAAEDTRVTMKLTERLGVRKPMVSCHRHNEDGRAPELVSRMLSEELTVALTCDAGTPGVSDPGQTLVAAAWEAGIPVIPVSGPSATVTALSAAGFDAREFAFYGFLPREGKALSEKLAAIRETNIPVAVIYESPHRVEELLKRMCAAWPGARVCLCCDLTKKFEKLERGTVEDVLDRVRANPNAEKGEYCLVADIRDVPLPSRPAPERRPEHALLDHLLAGETLAEAAAALASEGFRRNDIYRARLALDNLLNGDDEEEE